MTGLANSKYFNKICELSSIVSEDRDNNKITYEEWKQLHYVINAVWVKLCDLDNLTNCICCNEETPFKEMTKIKDEYYCKFCVKDCLEVLT